MAAKPEKTAFYREVTYTSSQWALLRQFRERTLKIMKALENFNLPSVVHGSIARGDVNAKSDIDIFIPAPQSSFLVETALEKAGIPISTRFVVQATPTWAIKAYIEIDDKAVVSFPLTQLRKIEREFYKFGGEIDIVQLEARVRVAGVSKRLVLIEPTEIGHIESSVIGRESYVAKILGISSETVLNRVNTLLKRDAVGRTGIFIKRELTVDETFEMALKKLSSVNPAVRRRVKKDGL
ncbi:MAG: nucleotidyltransferase domain-containing protein [Candidatus Bathyarchaeia archaeon]